MAKKIKFALELANGVKVRSGLEELREHFDMEKIAGYFLLGKLAEWLEDRFYDEEAEKIRNIDKNAPDFDRQICEVLGVDYNTDDEMDVAFLERVNEKKAILREKTANETIIANANRTALNQEDLADLLEMDEKTIYLCGDNFNIPIRFTDKKYIGVLGKPNITIKAKHAKELVSKNIIFENVKLPWNTDIPIKDQLDKKEEPTFNYTWHVSSDKTTNNDNTTTPNQNSSTIKPPPSTPTINIEKIYSQLASSIREFINNLNDNYPVDVLSLPSLYIDDYDAVSKSEKKNAIRYAADQYESEMREAFAVSLDYTTQYLQNIQSQYDQFFQLAKKTYIAPRPSAQEALQALQQGQQNIVSSIGGLGSKLASMAQFEAMDSVIGHFSDLFAPTEYQLENYSDLMSYADSYMDRMVDQYRNYASSGSLRAYFRSIKANLERLCQ